MKLLLEYRDRISTMNLRSLFNSCFGMYRGQMKDLTKPNSERQESMIAQYGYNTKKAMMSLHFLLFLVRFHNSGFKGFQDAISYEGSDREFMLGLKHGELSLDEFKKIASSNEEIVLQLEQSYYGVPLDKEANYYLKNLLQTLVKNHLKTI